MIIRHFLRQVDASIKYPAPQLLGQLTDIETVIAYQYCTLQYHSIVVPALVVPSVQ